MDGIVTDCNFDAVFIKNKRGEFRETGKKHSFVRLSQNKL